VPFEGEVGNFSV